MQGQGVFFQRMRQMWEIRTIDYHCQVDTLVARGARVTDLLFRGGVQL